ncbi:MAG: hypothetical protein QXN74_03840 [Saccharolobus sp.]
MKVVKYNLKAKIEKQGRETIIIERKFRKLINARNFINDLVKDKDVKCTPFNKSEMLITRQCEGNDEKYFFEISIQRIKKPKKQEETQKST